MKDRLVVRSTWLPRLYQEMRPYQRPESTWQDLRMSKNAMEIHQQSTKLLPKSIKPAESFDHKIQLRYPIYNGIAGLFDSVYFRRFFSTSISGGTDDRLDLQGIQLSAERHHTWARGGWTSLWESCDLLKTTGFNVIKGLVMDQYDIEKWYNIENKFNSLVRG